MSINLNNLKGLFSKLAGSPAGQFIKTNAIPIAAGAGGLAAGAGLVGLGSAVSNASDLRSQAASQGYVGADNAVPYIQNTYGVNPNIPSDITQLPPEVFKQLMLDPRHGGMWNPLTNEMIF